MTRKPLSTQIARRLVDEINRGAANVRTLLLRLHEGEGWHALGYGTWKECVESEFVFGRQQAYRLLTAAQIEQRVSPIGDTLLPETHARELAIVPEERQLEVYRRALETSPNGLTAEHIRRTVEAMGFRRRQTIFDDEADGPTTRRFQSSGTHQTPPELVSAIEGRFDLIEIDLAANTRNAVAGHFISKKENSLRQDWAKLLKGRMGYLNPPFDPMDVWANHAVTHGRAGARFVVICQASVDADWFWQMFPLCAVYALTPRVTFVGHKTGFPKPLFCCAFNLVGSGVAKKEVGRISRWFWRRENDQRLVRSY